MTPPRRCAEVAPDRTGAPAPVAGRPTASFLAGDGYLFTITCYFDVYQRLYFDQ